MKWELIWYDQESEKARDIIEADSQEEAIKQGYTKYNGNPPAPLVSAVQKN